MFKRLFFGIASLLLPMAWAQEGPKAPAFIAADVHVTPPDNKDLMPGTIRGTQFEMRGMTMLNALTRAYGLDADRILGGPRRLEIDKYDIIAKVPPDTKFEAAAPMLKALLAERFKLVVREETRPLQSFALTLGKGKHKLKPAEGSETRCNTSLMEGGAQPMRRLKCTGYSSTMLASLVRSVGLGTITTPVADQTGLTGNWDFELDAPMPTGSGVSPALLMDAIENQLGLKLEQKRTDQPVIVIVSMDTVPTENAPGVAEMMEPPLPPMELEVATVKPSAPGSPQGGMRFARSPQGGGMQLDAKGMKLSNLISTMWSIPAERILGLPPGIDDQPFDFLVQFTGEPGPSMQGTLGAAVQSLLKERFKMEAHLEDRPMDAYKLVAVKPKMAKADPENRASCKSGVALGAKDPREVTPGRTALYTCRNITMDEFAERLQGFSGGFLRMPAVNATNLEGMFDFTLNFTPQVQTTILSTGTGAVIANAPAPVAVGGTFSTGAAPIGAADPSDNITFQEALSSQLGLKLELEKRPMPVLVIDHLEKTPTEN